MGNNLTVRNVDEPGQSLLAEGTTPKTKSNFFTILADFKPILYFLPLILLISSDEASLLVNQILIVTYFNLETNLSAFGAILGTSQLIKAISLLVFGYLSDKFQRKKLLIISSTLWAISEVLVGISGSFEALFVFRVISATCSGAAASVILSLLADSFSSDNRGMSFAVWTMLTTIGVAIGGILCTAFNKVEIDFDVDSADFLSRIAEIRATNTPEVIRASWQTPFLVFGLVGFAFILLTMFYKEPKRAAKEKLLSEVLANDDVDYGKFYSIKFADLKHIWRRKTNFFLIINFFDTILAGMLTGFLFIWISGDLGLDHLSLYLLLLMVPIVIGLIWGNFYWPKRADKAVKAGDHTARVRMATFLGWVHLPFLLAGFAIIPNSQNLTFFNGSVQATPFTFGLGLAIMGLLIGIGMSFEMAVGPLHYSSMVDVNLPEHRSTMIAAASFMDAIGRALGTFLGSLIMDYFILVRLSPSPISQTLLFSLITFGTVSGLLWLPIYKYAKKDFAEVAQIMEERKQTLEKSLQQ
ncbi:MAG: MFS transporter [Promethearchaeota archaeon]